MHTAKQLLYGSWFCCSTTFRWGWF